MFRQQVLAQIIEQTSKGDSVRVPDETGIAAASYRTIKRRLPVYPAESWRKRLVATCAARAALGRRRWCSTT